MSKSCKRCLACCKEGGPVLHIEDLVLIKNNSLSLESIVCLRVGELVQDNVSGNGLKPLEKEILKIRGVNNSWQCVFLDLAKKNCSCYEARFFECKLFLCTEPLEFTQKYLDGRLTRSDLCVSGSAMSDIIIEHEERYPVSKALDLLRLKDKYLNDFCRDEQNFRNILKTKINCSDNLLDCFFGRSLFAVVGQKLD